MKRLVLILLVLVSVSCQAQFFGLNQNYSENLRYSNTGGLSTSATDTVKVAFPDSLRNGDIIMLVVSAKYNTTFTTPTEWSVFVNNADANLSFDWFWKRVDVTESDSLSVTDDVTASKFGIMYLLKDISPNNPYSIAGATSGSKVVNTGSTIAGIEDELAMFIWISDEHISSPSITGTNWITEDISKTTDNGGITFGVGTYFFTTTATSPAGSGLGFNSYQSLLKSVIK